MYLSSRGVNFRMHKYCFMIDEDKIQWLQDNYPFFSCVKYGNKKDYTESILESSSTATLQ